MSPSIVTFDQAFKLKNKGFNEYCYYSYDNNKKLIEPKLTNGSSTDTDFTVELTELEENYNRYDSSISAPEHWMVIEWLRVKHNIWIHISADNDYTFKFEINTWSWHEHEKCHRVGHRVLGESIWETSSKPYNSPQEATSAAIDYVLNNLI